MANDIQQGCQHHLMGKAQFPSTNGAGKAGYSHTKNEVRLLEYTVSKTELDIKT